MSTLIKLSSKNQLTLPRSVRKVFPSTRYYQCSVRRNEVVLRPVSVDVDGGPLEKIRDRLAKAGVKETIVADAVAWARGVSR